MSAFPPWTRAVLGTAVAGSVAILATSLAQGLISNILRREPLHVKLVEEERQRPPGPQAWPEESEPELLQDANLNWQPMEQAGVAPGVQVPPQSLASTLAPPLHRYSRLNQIWDDYDQKWVDFEQRPARREAEDDELLYWFKVYSRRKTASKDEKPAISIEVLSRTLINFLRSVLGSSSTFARRPTVSVHELFPHQDKFMEWLERLEPSVIRTLDFKAQQDMATSLGVPNVKADYTDEKLLHKHFESVYMQLSELMTCLKEEFKPIQEEMTMYLAHGHMTFDLLGYVFKPGCKLLMQDNLTGDKMAVRMTSCEYQTTPSPIPGKNTRIFILNGNGRRWNGTKYALNEETRSINEWKGTMSLESLPWSILATEDEQELTERGRVYCQYSGIFHVFNNGPLGGKGRAMVDCRSHGNLYPEPSSPRPIYRRPYRSQRHQPRVDRWAGGNWDEAPQDGGWGAPQAVDWENAESDYDPDVAPGGVNDDISDKLSEGELCLLPPTVLGFMLREKDWVNMRVLSLAPVTFDRHAWGHLVLDPDTKLLIRSLVDVTCKDSAQSLVRDVITGKGGGLVAVLHGKPGTGKTLTAEAVAEHLERPIYIVGSEELPFDASSLEQRLRGILDLAARWDAVLLIDEADVFLEQRSLHELQRNAVVSVALRLLEYHSGVIFLTTNRIKSFDEAFLSRFSIGIKYPDLDQASRLVIWRSFLRMADVEIVNDESDMAAVTEDGKSRILVKDLEKLAKKAFNGRSIKNLVRTSQALALANNEPLGIEHVRIVTRTSEQFLHDFEEIQGSGA